MKRNGLILLGVAVIFILTATEIFSQAVALTEQEEEFPIEDWVVGDVVALDLEGNQLALIYIDYQTNEEKEITIGVDDKTRYENVNKLQDIKVGDVISVDYRITPGGKNIASTISVERIKEVKPSQ